MGMNDSTDEPWPESPELEEPRGRGRRPGAALAAVLAFALLVAGVAVLAARGTGASRLPVLPAAEQAATGAQTPSAAMDTAGGLMVPFGPVTYQVQGTLPPLADHAPAYRLNGAISPSTVVKVAAALGLNGTPKDANGQWTLQDGARSLIVGHNPPGRWFYNADSQCVPVALQEGQPAAVACGGVGLSGSASTGPGMTATGSVTGTEVAPAPAPPAPPDGSATAPAPATTAPPSATTGPTAASGMCLRPPCSGGACPDICVSPPAPCALKGSSRNDCPVVTVPSRPADLPSAAGAEKVASDLVGRLGVNLTHAAVDTVETFSGWQVSIQPQLGGLPTQGYLWSVMVGSKSAVTQASGELATPSLLGSYPLIGTAAGLERLKAGNRIGGGIVPMLGAARVAVVCPSPANAATPTPRLGATPPPATPTPQLGATATPATPTPTPGPATAYPRPATPAPNFCRPQVVTVTGVHLALVEVVGPSQAVLEPAYQFETSGAGDIGVLATVDRLIAPAPVPTEPVRPPKVVPVPAPGVPAPAANSVQP